MADGSFSYEIVGMWQDITDIVTNIDPDATPLLTLFSNGKPAKATTVTSLNDQIGTPDSTPIQEGAEVTALKVTARSKVDNYVQIFDRPFYVTDTAQAVDSHGVSDEIAYQTDLKSKLIGLDLEKAIVTHDTAVAASNGVAPKMGGVPFFNDVNVVSSTVFTEAKTNDATAMAWEVGGQPSLGVLSMTNKRIANTFNAGGNKTRDQKDRTVIGPVEFYEADGGKIKWLPHRLIGSARVDFLDPKHFKMRFLVPFHVEPLAKTGHKQKFMVTGQATLECRSKDAQACITGIA
jgi:hypothetical protein